jgi:hypothetical protein
VHVDVLLVDAAVAVRFSNQHAAAAFTGSASQRGVRAAGHANSARSPRAFSNRARLARARSARSVRGSVPLRSAPAEITTFDVRYLDAFGLPEVLP